MTKKKEMNYRIGDESDADNTWYLGEINISYTELVKLFGEPVSDGDGYKVDAEWILVFEDGEVATIYNYKNGRNYLGSSGKSKERIRYWHIGGRNEIVVDRVKEKMSV